MTRPEHVPITAGAARRLVRRLAADYSLPGAHQVEVTATGRITVRCASAADVDVWAVWLGQSTYAGLDTYFTHGASSQPAVAGLVLDVCALHPIGA